MEWRRQAGVAVCVIQCFSYRMNDGKLGYKVLFVLMENLSKFFFFYFLENRENLELQFSIRTWSLCCGENECGCFCVI